MKFTWTCEAQSAYKKMMEKLKGTPVLEIPDDSKQFELYTDASTYGLGAMLAQEVKAIVYTSRTLNNVERNSA